MIISFVAPVRSLVSMMKNICSKSEDMSHSKEIKAKESVNNNIKEKTKKMEIDRYSIRKNRCLNAI